MRSVHTRLLARTRACCVSSCWLPAALDWLRSFNLFQNGGLREEQSRLVTTILWSALRLKGQSIFGWSSNYTADSVIRYAHVYVPRPDRASLSPLFWNNLNERSQSNAVAACRVCTLRMHACSGAGTRAVPHRGRAPRFANHGSIIDRFMDRSLNACKTFRSRNRFDLWIGH